jgi:hypothetical protein
MRQLAALVVLLSACDAKVELPPAAVGGDGGSAVTYCGDVHRIVTDNCVSCHATALTGAARGGAPTDLNFDTYALCHDQATTMNLSIQSGHMPPGSPLSAADRALFNTWATGGTPEGDCTGTPDAGPIVLTCSTGAHWTGGENDALMRPGDNCMSCHNDTVGPLLRLGGTVMGAAHDENDCLGIPGVTVAVTHGGGTFQYTSNASGNFTAVAEDAPAIQPPYSVELTYQTRTRAMSAQQTSTACNSCHTATGGPGRILAP